MMRCCRTHSNNGICCLFILVSITILSNCTAEKVEQPESYIARVGDKFLTKKDLLEYSAGDYKRSFITDEYIRHWVEKNVLLQSALEEGIEQDEAFIGLTESAYEQLLVKYFIENYLIDEIAQPDIKELKEYYESNRNKFEIKNDIYILNLAEFETREAALGFVRTGDKDFRKRIRKVENENVNVRSWLNERYDEFDFPDKVLFDAVKYLNASEYSNIIVQEQNKFLVVQLVNKINKRSAGNFDLIADYIKDIYVAEKKQLALDKLIERLYDNYEIEIKRDQIDNEN